MHYYGDIKDVNELNKIYDEHTFIISPSHSEGMPNVLLEGMSRGLIPIATAVGAVEELVNHSNGFLIEPKNIPSIQETVERVLSLEMAELDILSTKSIETIRSHFTWSQIIAQTTENFQRVVEKP